MTPMRGIFATDCCARAASGHTAAAPPSKVMKSRRLIRLNRIRCPSRGPKHHIGLVRMESVACCAAGFLPGQPPLWVIFGLSRLGALGSLCPECPNSGHQSLGSIRPSQSARQSIGTGCRPFRTRASGRSTRRFWRRQASRPTQKIRVITDVRSLVAQPESQLATALEQLMGVPQKPGTANCAAGVCHRPSARCIGAGGPRGPDDAALVPPPAQPLRPVLRE